MADNKLLGAGGLYYGTNEISKAYMGNNLVWEKEEINPFIKEYFTIQSLVNNNTITFFKNVDNGSYTISDKPIKYSKDLNTWTDMSFVSGNGSKIVLNSGEKLYLKGNNSTYGRMVSTSRNNYYAHAEILSSGNIDVMGNIMSLIYGDNFIKNNTIESSYAFLRLFKGSNKLVNAKDLILPATTLANYCYEGMFMLCYSLITAPELPATTLAYNCYTYMFYNCEALKTAPELPATTLAQSCYYHMFESCDALTTGPSILPATTLANHCYNGMFYDCYNLTAAPELPATTLADRCYSGMFYYCTKLNYIKAMFTTTPSSTYTSNWVYRVSARGTFVKNSEATWNVTGENGIPSGWTVTTASS